MNLYDFDTWEERLRIAKQKEETEARIAARAAEKVAAEERWVALQERVASAEATHQAQMEKFCAWFVKWAETLNCPLCPGPGERFAFSLTNLGMSIELTGYAHSNANARRLRLDVRTSEEQADKEFSRVLNEVAGSYGYLKSLIKTWVQNCPKKG